VLPVLVCFRVFGGQRSPLLRRLLDPEPRIDQEHEQDAVIVDPKVAACFTNTHVAKMVGYLSITGLGNAYCARENLPNTACLSLIRAIRLIRGSFETLKIVALLAPK
jgi:hypothetical protein